MITGSIKERSSSGYVATEKNYRKISALNQSMISLFDENPMQFFDEYVLGHRREKKPNYSFDIGDLADFYLLDCEGNEEIFNQRFDEKFAKFEGNKSTAQAFTLADNLFDLTLRDTDEEGNITTTLEERFKEAFDLTQKAGKYSGKTWDKGLEDFNKTAKTYFETKMNSIGKSVVGLGQIEKAKKLVDQLRNDEFLGDFINQVSNEDVEVLKKVVVEFEYRGYQCKAEIDFMHIDHYEKKVRIKDLKTAFDNESFQYSFLKYYYYIQAAFYFRAAEAFIQQYGLEGYKVEPMEFLVLDTSKNSRRPLLYKTTLQHVFQGLDGFDYRDNHYRGVDELMDEIKWCEETNNWNISKENFDNKGVVNLKSY